MRVEESITLRCRPSAVWQYVGDPSRYEDFMAGVTRWTLLREGDKGVLGSRYAMRLRVGSANVGGEVEIVEHREPCDIAWTAVTGVTQRGRWRVREVDPGVVQVSLRLAYQSPGGLWGLV
ncbi:MAG: SRPBCC family protein, partial [Candidatus Dormibacteraeota bacterium]|nr:SRPBCC family protein [Candidatus Dormibacteraeota bacterium]